MELQRWKMDEEKRLEEARFAEEAALALAERDKAKCLAAMQTAEASKRIAETEAQKRYNAEMKVVKQAEEKNAVYNSLSHTNLRYRRCSIEEIEAATENFADNKKIREGGYGPVYRCTLDHTAIAIKVLRPMLLTEGRNFSKSKEMENGDPILATRSRQWRWGVANQIPARGRLGVTADLTEEAVDKGDG
ncbi:hypothetical protein Cni_G13635 [Canna indica]|uniref:RING-type E3 ubiquitin transferase n=1 Tax=Canna indica TaxID=4628 RepID=A0AAQ3KA81_9LILI|nr:hypothetical protein Cni_G13635 [Canna indica]